MWMDVDTLLAANAVILFVMAGAFLSAWIGRRNETYWRSWIFANLVLGAALLIFLAERSSPTVWIPLLGNAMLVAGLGLRWRAAREFAGRPAGALMVWGPAGLFVALHALPWFFGHHGVVFTTVNILLTVQAFAIAYEFWRDRSDRLPSRYGLVMAYSVMGASFGIRVVQGLFFGDGFQSYLPHDVMLEIHLIVALLQTTASGAFALSLAYERSAVELRAAALRDPLTGLYNRRAFEERVRDLLAREADRPFAVVLFDVDHFKRVNDRHGHAAGDAALRACAEICARSLREGDVLARIGGEEFAAILPDITPENAFKVTDRIRRRVGAARLRFRDHQFCVTLSAGICHSVGGMADFDALLRKADERLYRAKAAGRDRVEQIAA